MMYTKENTDELMWAFLANLKIMIVEKMFLLE